MSKTFEQLKPYMEKLAALQAALTLFDWDSETIAPAASMEKTSKLIGTLSAAYFDALVNNEMMNVLKKAKGGNCTRLEKKLVEKIEEEAERLKVIPAEEYQEFAELKAVSAAKWQEAKAANDFSIFSPYLKKVIVYTKKFAEYQHKGENHLYDVMLKDYEKGFTTKELDDFFEQLKEAILPLVKQIQAKGKRPKTGFLFDRYPVEEQKKFNVFLANYLGFDTKRGVLAESEHPFTTSLHNDDVRITTHYYENNLESAVFSTIHETGHALFELGNDDKITMTPLAGGSCAVHESQSRMYENMIGRSRAFWEPLYGQLQQVFEKQLGQVALDDFIAAINRTEPSLLRTESDELTYCLHIIIRYEIEKQLMEQDISIDDLPKLWNDKYEEYLGISPQKESEGILQDIHWSQGSFGYFPFYAVGNAMAAQIYHAMDKELNVEECLRNGQMNNIYVYLKEHIHRFGMAQDGQEMLKETTGEEFNPKYYIDYLTEKFTGLYL